MRFNKEFKNDNFIEVNFTRTNLDRYYIRTSIRNALEENLKFFKGYLVDLGCGKMPYRKMICNEANIEKYVGVDIETALSYSLDVKPDVFWDGKALPFPDNTVNTIIATEVLEHCPNPKLILEEIFRVLKNEGIFFFTVPFLWTLHEIPNDEFRYTPFCLERLFTEVGFRKLSIKSLGGWNASLAQMLGLWVMRSPMRKRDRNLLSFLLKPIIQRLIKKDFRDSQFREGQMITGLYGIIQK